jgi:AcrR family transcriptional regulator
MARVSKKESILDAAEKILQDENYDSLSLDRIAEVSGISKGGLLYHFPTKESVLVALVSRLIDTFDSEFDKEMNKGKLDFKEIFLAVNSDPKMVASSRGLMAAISFNRSLLQPLKEAYKRWDRDIFSQFESSDEAWRFRIFFDGLFFCHLLDLPQPSKKELKSIIKGFKTKKVI